jgi:hypothetical protein
MLSTRTGPATEEASAGSVSRGDGPLPEDVFFVEEKIFVGKAHPVLIINHEELRLNLLDLVIGKGAELFNKMPEYRGIDCLSVFFAIAAGTDHHVLDRLSFEVDQVHFPQTGIGLKEGRHNGDGDVFYVPNRDISFHAAKLGVFGKPGREVGEFCAA